MVLLSELDSKKYKTILKFKQESLILLDSDSLPKKAAGGNKIIDNFGEITVTQVKKPQKRLMPEEKQKIISEYQNGRSTNELADEYDCHSGTIRAVLRKHGIEPRKIDDIVEAESLIAGYNAGKSTHQLADEFGCSRTAVSNILKRHGIELDRCTAQKRLDADAVISMYAEMHTTKEIAKQFSVSPKAIIKCLRDHDVKLRNRWDYT